MADEIQLHLEGSSRDDNVATGVELNLVDGEFGVNRGATWLEGIYKRKDDSTFLHFPSEEKLSQTAKANKSGAQFIGVDAGAMTTLTSTDLQSILEEIDTNLSATGLTGVVLQDGTRPMEAEWTVEQYIRMGGAVHVNPYIDPNAFPGAALPRTLDSLARIDGDLIMNGDANGGSLQHINDNGFDTGTPWETPTGDASISGGKLNFAYSTGSGSVVQLNGNLLNDLVTARGYVLIMSFSNLATKGTYNLRFDYGTKSRLINTTGLVDGVKYSWHFTATGETSAYEILEGADIEIKVDGGSSGDAFEIELAQLYSCDRGTIYDADLLNPNIKGEHREVNVQVGNYQIKYVDSFILVRANTLTITLPPAVDDHVGFVVDIRNSSTHSGTTVDTADSTTIEGSATDSLASAYRGKQYILLKEGATFMWHIITQP